MAMNDHKKDLITVGVIAALLTIGALLAILAAERSLPEIWQILLTAQKGRWHP